MTRAEYEELLHMASETIGEAGMQAEYEAITSVCDEHGNPVYDVNGDPLRESLRHEVKVLRESISLADVGISGGALQRGDMVFWLAGDALPMPPDTAGRLWVQNTAYALHDVQAEAQGEVVILWKLYARAMLWGAG